MPSWVKRGTTSAVIVAALTACGSAAAPAAQTPVGTTLPVHAAVDFRFDSLDDRPLSTAALRGKPAVIAFVASDDLASQAQVDFLATMAKHDGDRVTYAFVAMETPDRRELVEGFRHFFETKFGVTLLAAMADGATLEGKGPFGDLRGLTVVLLDKDGHLAWLHTGLAKSEEIRAAMRTL